MRVYNSLKRAGISTIGDLMEMIDKNGGSLMNLRNFGEKSMLELKDKLKQRGLIPNDDDEPIVGGGVEPADDAEEV